MSHAYIKFKRTKIGLCNICKNNATLTWDHVPPKGGIEVTSVEQEAIFQRLTTDNKKRQYVISQNGVKYRTICKKCNDHLGGKYDPILNDFAIGVGRFLKTKLVLPPILEYETRPIMLIRAILGHLLAAKPELDNVPVDNQIRTFLFDETLKLPESIKIYYWVYPYQDIILIRDIVMPALRGNFKKYGFFNILKYFPIAYLICDLDQYEGLNELSSYRGCRPDQTAKIPICLKRVRHRQWPEMVDEGNFLLLGESGKHSIHARPRY